ncbi:hypothetical protein [Bifidobacterium platyrrhinorum]|uniref:Uncharacterized protein n=1 Tax=Bifidobacterium platyrrhinorum TaxID=2661628 RepID=A0A6L9ST12_9BIFI|nr:hypothetical protein [Bifidobacterium platyrrhinorum]NEG54963.1 hypothetical protein [Bifidobacterium platyrrhinorum]
MAEETQGKDLLTQAEKDQAVKAARNNDLRRLIAILFIIYGVIVTIVGIVAPNMNGADTNGIAINLWTGIVMLVIGIAFELWCRFKPLSAEDIIASAEESVRKAQVQHEGSK